MATVSCILYMRISMWWLLLLVNFLYTDNYYICYDRSARAKLITNTNHFLGLVALLVYDHIQLGEWALHDICSYRLNILSHTVLMESNHLRPINWVSTPCATTAYDSMQVNCKCLPCRGLSCGYISGYIFRPRVSFLTVYTEAIIVCIVAITTDHLKLILIRYYFS